MQDDYISTEHLLLGLCAVGKPATLNNFENFDLSEKKIKRYQGSWRAESDIKNPENSFRALKKYGIDLVEQAKSGNLTL